MGADSRPQFPFPNLEVAKNRAPDKMEFSHNQLIRPLRPVSADPSPGRRLSFYGIIAIRPRNCGSVTVPSDSALMQYLNKFRQVGRFLA